MVRSTLDHARGPSKTDERYFLESRRQQELPFHTYLNNISFLSNLEVWLLLNQPPPCLKHSHAGGQVPGNYPWMLFPWFVFTSNWLWIPDTFRGLVLNTVWKGRGSWDAGDQAVEVCVSVPGPPALTQLSGHFRLFLNPFAEKWQVRISWLAVYVSHERGSPNISQMHHKQNRLMVQKLIQPWPQKGDA